MSASEVPAASDAEVVLVRHAETEWSREHKHTGRTDIPLTEQGRIDAVELGERLRGRRFALVLCSPARRARETCELCGLGEQAQERGELWEWDYGEYDGLTLAQIRARRPGWNLWRDGCPGGESAADVGARVDRAILETRAQTGDVAVFSHGHVLRVLGARWVELDAAAGAHLTLFTAALSMLGYEREAPVLRRWNT
jgi:probable phosphoglycerate mutase